MTLLLIALKLGLNASIFMRIEISRILYNSCNYMVNSGSHDFSANTNYRLIYTERMLYNIPIGKKYFNCEMNMHTLKLGYN